MMNDLAMLLFVLSMLMMAANIHKTQHHNGALHGVIRIREYFVASRITALKRKEKKVTQLDSGAQNFIWEKNPFASLVTWKKRLLFELNFSLSI